MLTIYKIRQGILIMKNCLENFLKKFGKNYDKGQFFFGILGIVSVKKIIKNLVYKRIKPEVYYQQQTSGFLCI